MTVIKQDVIVEETSESKLPTKDEALINLINSKPNGRFLIFSEYDNSFGKVSSLLDQENIRWSKLCGSTGHISNIIKSYTNNQIKVLLLNAKHYGSGLNLQMTTDIIL